jgi:hypothetical protein
VDSGLALKVDPVHGCETTPGRSADVRWKEELDDPTARFVDLGPDFHDRHVNLDRRTRALVRQLMAFGHQVTLSPAA